MRFRFAQIIFFATACLLLCKPLVAQSSDPSASCPNSATSDDEQPSGAEISISEVTFSGSLLMPISEQEKIADSVRQRTHGTTLEDVTEKGVERVRAGWQDRGYFKVQVTAETKTLTSSPVSQRIAMSVYVDEGQRYNLKRIRFKNNKAISRVDVLRGLFPIADGELFSREKVASGLENLRKAYGELGYINFTSVPDTQFDDENRLISLVIDVDEGKQFYVRSVDVQGLDETSRQEVLNDFPVGQIYNQRIFFLWLEKHYDMFRFSVDDPSRTLRRLDEKAGTVDITLDARPCPSP
jgi:outer membrane protein assembly factor BamA